MSLASPTWFLQVHLPFLPIGIIVLKVSIFHRERQDSGVMVEPKIIIGSLNPLNLLRSELRQPAEIESN